jgi:hypothetical protein
VKFQLQPAGSSAKPPPPGNNENYLRDELVDRLKKGPVLFDFKIQRFVDERSTPVEDVVTAWSEAVSPLTTVAQLMIPQQDLAGAAGRQADRAADILDYTPWNCLPGFRPIGRMSRVRRRVYEASVEHRKGVAR